jgi:hypothetical protein
VDLVLSDLLNIVHMSRVITASPNIVQLLHDAHSIVRPFLICASYAGQSLNQY